jgi:putative ABC transport system permease protein
MAIPISYNLRNLVVRKTTTLMTAAGIAMTIAVLMAVMGLNAGLKSTFSAQGDTRNLLLLRKGGTAELTSLFTPQWFQIVKGYPGIATGKDGQPLASLEVVTIVTLSDSPEASGVNITVRGLSPAGIEIRHPALIAGQWFKPGLRQLVVGKSIAKRYDKAHIGKQLKFGRGYWTVVGVMDGGESAINSEIWSDGNEIAADFNRSDAWSSAFVRAQDVVTAAALQKSLMVDRRLNIDVMTEPDYYGRQTQSAAPINYLGGFVCIIMAIGSAFAAMNTMYAAVARRSQEVGTLRVLGFSKGSIMLSFLIESVLLSVMGGLLACIIVLPLNGLTTGIGNFVTFSETSFNFKIGLGLMAIGILFSAVLGAIGGLFPAAQAARKEILIALRQT